VYGEESSKRKKKESSDGREKEKGDRDRDRDREGDGDGQGRLESGQFAKILKLLRLRETKECRSDKFLTIVVNERLRWFQEDLVEKAEREFYGNLKNHMGLPARRGRRLDLDAKDLKLRGAVGNEDRPLYVKVTVAGSGDGNWRTHHVNLAAGMGRGWDEGGNTRSVVYYERDAGQGTEIEIAGVGGGGPIDKILTAGGMKDGGSNKISKVTTDGLTPILEAFRDVAEEGRGRPIVVLFRSHSRGAAAASQMATAIKEQYSNVQVELSQLDPVPGPGHHDEAVEIDVGSLDESTLVYSIAPGYPTSFTPQKVHGAKRIIISRQDHGVGIEHGFIYNDIRYRGSALNSLEPGVYIDAETRGDPKNARIKLVAAPIGDLKGKIKLVYNAVSGAKVSSMGNRNREELIKEILEEYYAEK